MMAGLVCLAVAVYFSPVYGLVIFGFVYLAAISYSIRERAQQKEPLRTTPPAEPLPDLEPFVYLPMEEIVPSGGQKVQTRVPFAAPPVTPGVSQPPVSVPPMAMRIEHDMRFETIRSLYRAIHELVVVNRSASVVKVIGDDILKEAADLVQEAQQIDGLRRRLAIDIASSPVSLQEIQRLEEQMSNESDTRLRITLAETITTKKEELLSIQQMQRDRGYHDALLSQAEASLSELRSRLALTISKSQEYIVTNDGHKLAEVSSDLRSISEAMRKTVEEIGRS